ncbi:hypothetical protein DXG03_003215 [Asterophora parasitica]|uniref:Conserved oligomeric Golgi complex subunit 7 n=1 Tax=Asterophora parasitica TaxID=117018 RepID=A0A9P7GFC9_9AGAR|nr:hypothetical protein DXG03_003215 [Asterophora parasitica]
MNATIESLFGLSSDVIDIPAFVRAAAEIDRATYNRETALHTPECSVDDLRTSLFDSWNSPSLSAYLSKDHDHVITSLYSTTKSAKPKRKTALLDPDSLPPDVAAFQNNLDAVKLTSWKLKIDSATFIRVSKNSDQNVLAQVKPSPEPSGHLSDTDPQAVITVTIHTRSTWTPGYINRSSQHALLSNQTLGDLFQVIPCTSNEIVNKYAFTGTSNFENRRPKGEDGCVICIENLAYGDGFGQGDYAQKLVEHLQTVSKDPPAITKAPTTIYETPLASLLLRVNQPYWLLHQGNCEHFLVVDQIRLQHAADVRSGYPLTLQITPPLLDLCRALPMTPSTTELIDSLEQYSDVVSWINDILDASEDDDERGLAPTELTELDEHITQLLATLDIACEDTSSQLEHTIDDVSRGVPRLTYDLHFMKDSALSLQTSLAKVLQKSKEAVPDSTSVALDHLRYLDMIKGRMEATREALREAESWSSLELEVTSLLAERSYAKAAERLSEASRSMVVFHNTPEYEPRRTLLVNLQNQLEASLSSALVAAINSQDVAVCRNYFSIFCHIQRESEFRNYYNASRRASVVAVWHDALLTDCESSDTHSAPPAETFTVFLPKFYRTFLSLLDLERISIPAIFPDPAVTLSAFISSTLSSLQPTFSQRLSSLSAHHGEAVLHQLISSLQATEEFASSVEKLIEKMSYAATPSASDAASPESAPPTNPRSHARRRSTRMSISWRPGAHLPSAAPGASSKLFLDGLEWDQELFTPFLDFQLDYGSLERRLLDHSLHKIISSDSDDRVPDADRARLLRERAIDAITVAEESLTRCTAFTHGYGSVGLVLALDNFFQSFIDIWTADVRLESHNSTSQSQVSASDDDLSDMDYSSQDWSDFQLSLHLLSSARAVYERISSFEAKLRSSLVQTATRFRLASNEPTSFTIAPSRGESRLLEQSPLNSADLHALLTSVEVDTHSREPLPSSRLSQIPVTPGSPSPLLIEARRAVFTFANTCQISLQGTILSPLRKHLASYASSRLWSASGDPKSKHAMTAHDLQVPTFSLSPSDTVQRVAEGLLNLPRLFEVYADDDALAFSLHSLPHIDPETLKGLSEQTSSEALPQPTHMRRGSLSTTKLTPLDPDAVSSAWLSSLGHTLLEHLTTTILPNIPSLSQAGAAQLASDLEYLSNIVRAINVEFPELDRWKELVELDDEEGKKRLEEAEDVDHVLRIVASLRRWER